jgi:hypothetical protein
MTGDEWRVIETAFAHCSFELIPQESDFRKDITQQQIIDEVKTKHLPSDTVRSSVIILFLGSALQLRAHNFLRFTSKQNEVKVLDIANFTRVMNYLQSRKDEVITQAIEGFIGYP